MLSRVKPIIAAITTVAMLSACGGGGSSSTPTPSPAPDPAPTPDPTTLLSGSVAKGIVLGGVVSAYYVTASGEKGAQIGESSTTSETDGTYQLELPSDYDGSPFMIEITAQEGTMMRCDLAQCSADPLVEFGDDYPLGANFVLRSMSSGVSEESDTINATILTTMATELTLKRVASGASVVEATATAKSQVANVFGITGDVNDVPVIDITDPTAVNNADADTLEANLVNAAVAQSSQQSGAALEDAVKATVTQYADHGFADNDGGVDDTTSATLEEILTEAQSLILKIEEKAEMEGVELDTEVTETKTVIATQTQVKSTSTNTEAKQGDADPNAGSAGLVASKQFAKQVRDLNNATGMEGALNTFDMEVTMAEQMASQNTQAIFIAIEDAAAAVGEAYEMVTFGDFTGTTYTAMNELVVAITPTELGNTYTIEAPEGANVNGIPITGFMTFSDNGTSISEDITQTSTGSQSDIVAMLDMSVSGSLTATTNYATTLTLSEGSHVVLKMNETMTMSETNTSFSDSYQGLVEVVDIALQVVLEQPAVVGMLENPVTFTGSIDIDVTNYTYSDSYTSNYDGNSFQDSGTLSESIDAITLMIAGELTNGITTLDAAITLALENLANSCTWSTGSDGVWSETCMMTDEPTDFPMGSLTLAFDATVAGLSENNSVSVMATLSRSLYDTVGLNLELSYAGLMMDVEATQSPQGSSTGMVSMTMTNQAGVSMMISAQEDEMGMMVFESGTISFGGTKYADVSEKADGTVLVTYTDGTFESF